MARGALSRPPESVTAVRVGTGDVPAACASVGEPLARVMTLLGKRWTGVVLATLMQGPVYFNDLKRGVTGISDRVLNERLLELAALGLLTRTVVDGPPIRVRYQLTEDGLAIRPAMDALTSWAETHLDPSRPARARV